MWIKFENILTKEKEFIFIDGNTRIVFKNDRLLIYFNNGRTYGEFLYKEYYLKIYDEAEYVSNISLIPKDIIGILLDKFKYEGENL